MSPQAILHQAILTQVIFLTVITPQRMLHRKEITTSKTAQGDISSNNIASNSFSWVIQDVILHCIHLVVMSWYHTKRQVYEIVLYNGSLRGPFWLIELHDQGIVQQKSENCHFIEDFATIVYCTHFLTARIDP